MEFMNLRQGYPSFRVLAFLGESAFAWKRNAERGAPRRVPIKQAEEGDARCRRATLAVLDLSDDKAKVLEISMRMWEEILDLMKKGKRWYNPDPSRFVVEVRCEGRGPHVRYIPSVYRSGRMRVKQEEVGRELLADLIRRNRGEISLFS